MEIFIQLTKAFGKNVKLQKFVSVTFKELLEAFMNKKNHALNLKFFEQVFQDNTELGWTFAEFLIDSIKPSSKVKNY